jgi:hypothetical protein
VGHFFDRPGHLFLCPQSTTCDAGREAGDEESIMNSRNVRRSVVTAVAVGAVAVAGAVSTGGTAAAATGPAAPAQCDAGQLTTTLVAGDPGAGQRYASVQFTAKAGQTCQLTGVLPLSLTGAAGVRVVPDGTTGSPVTLGPGQSGYELLHWGAIAPPAQQVTPAGVRVQTPGPAANVVSVPWNQGPVDNTPTDDTVTVSPVVAGTAEY